LDERAVYFIVAASWILPFFVLNLAVELGTLRQLSVVRVSLFSQRGSLKEYFWRFPLVLVRIGAYTWHLEFF
jgi:hypothetical protein